MLTYTGHPLADIGAATIAAYAGKGHPRELTEEDLKGFAAYIAELYTRPVMKPYLSCVFTMNAVYTQPSWKPERRHEEALAYLSREGTDVGLPCAYSGAPAQEVVSRQHVPMLTGDGVLNFFPAAIGGLPLARPYVLAVQAFPLGARRCLGRALAVHCPDDSDLTFRFAKQFLRQNRQLIQLAEGSGEKYPDLKAARTFVVDTLVSLELERWERQRYEGATPPSVTVYHLTNSGQGPGVERFDLPSQVVGFLRRALGPVTRATWLSLVAMAWPKNDKGDPPSPSLHRNRLYERLFEFPERAGPFIREFLLRQGYRKVIETPTAPDLKLVSWAVTQLFLQEVLGMEQHQVDAIRELGDRIADHVVSDNDWRFFQDIYRERRYDRWRGVLIKASKRRLEQKPPKPPLVGFDECVQVFETGDWGWSLARDLVLIRAIERLYQQQGAKLAETLGEIEEDEEE